MTMIRALLDLVCPRACRMCGRRLSLTEQEICGVCNWQLPRTDFCSSAYDNPMARLFWGRFQVERVAAWIYYQPGNDQCKLIHDIKYYGAELLAETMGEMVAREFAEYDFFEGIDMIIPVPLTFMRRLKRGYNQTEKIARGISGVTNIPVKKNILYRTKFTESQTRLTGSERYENVQGVFQAKDSVKLSGKHILLVDDIITTGATASACAEELSKNSDVKISILSLGFTK